MLLLVVVVASHRHHGRVGIRGQPVRVAARHDVGSSLLRMLPRRGGGVGNHGEGRGRSHRRPLDVRRGAERLGGRMRRRSQGGHLGRSLLLLLLRLRSALPPRRDLGLGLLVLGRLGLLHLHLLLGHLGLNLGLLELQHLQELGGIAGPPLLGQSSPPLRRQARLRRRGSRELLLRRSLVHLLQEERLGRPARSLGHGQGDSPREGGLGLGLLLLLLGSQGRGGHVGAAMSRGRGRDGRHGGGGGAPPPAPLAAALRPRFCPAAACGFGWALALPVFFLGDDFLAFFLALALG